MSMTVLTLLNVILSLALAVAIVGIVGAYLVRPVREMEDDPYLTVHGDQPHAPYAARRSPTERLDVPPRMFRCGVGWLEWDGNRWTPESPGSAVAGRRAGGGSVSGAAARSPGGGAAA